MGQQMQAINNDVLKERRCGGHSVNGLMTRALILCGWYGMGRALGPSEKWGWGGGGRRDDAGARDRVGGVHTSGNPNGSLRLRGH